MRAFLIGVWMCCLLCSSLSDLNGGEGGKATVIDPFKDDYASYKPDFVGDKRWLRSAKQMKLSSEKSFFTLALVSRDARADALVEAGIAKEKEGAYREALKIYQTLFDQRLSKDSGVLYKVSPHGVYVPVSQYVQRRILNLPKEDLAFYRTLHDAKAKEAFEQARRKYSLTGLTEIVDKMLATSYGDNAVFELGNAALDSGHFLSALEYFVTIRDYFKDSDCRTPELDLKIAYCRKMLGRKDPKGGGAAVEAKLPAEVLARFKKILSAEKVEPKKFHSQIASAPHIAADDYTLMPPTTDPLALKSPVWKHRQVGSRRDFLVFSQPVVTRNSIIYRHKNIIYARSILNGELRWKNDIGGRAIWQHGRERKYPMEDLIVRDGLVFTPMFKVGPSLLALDEVTGQMKWAYGPIAASTLEESRMRFEAAPASGPRTIYACYVLDNIEGETHTDTSYGVIAFDSASGRVRWRRQLCRLTPGKFASGFAFRVRNRIRSFTSPPLYHEGTVYAITNAGTVAALDSLSGRVKWLMRYPYNPGIHDSTRGYRGNTLYFNQRPLLIGERLYVLPVDSELMLCLDRRTGKVIWSRPKLGHGFHYFLGTISTGELVWVTKGRNKRGYNVHHVRPPVTLLDPKTGKETWKAPDIITRATHPVMYSWIYGVPYAWVDANVQEFQTAARPFLSSDDVVYIMNWRNLNTRTWMSRYMFHLAAVDLKNRKVVHRRRYLTGGLLTALSDTIREGKKAHDAYQKLPHKNKQIKAKIAVAGAVMKDTVPENKYGPFMPFSRVTFKRYGVDFELRFGPRELQMVYDHEAVQRVLAKRTDPEALFARAELALGESRLESTAKQFKQCLKAISSEDLDFRATVNQQLFGVHKRLTRAAIRTGNLDKDLENCLGMSRTAGTLAEEIETLFAFSEAYERRGEWAAAARCLQSIIDAYGHHEYPIPSVVAAHPQRILESAKQVLAKVEGFTAKSIYEHEMGYSAKLLQKGMPLYLSTVSPLPKDLTVRAGELAAARLARLQKRSAEFAKTFAATAADKLARASAEEQLHRLWRYPANPISQKVLSKLLQDSAKKGGADGRKKLWMLADAARVGGLTVPKDLAPRVQAPRGGQTPMAITLPLEQKDFRLPTEEDTQWLVLERRGDRSLEPNRLFVAGRTRKRLDNKFSLVCVDLKTNKELWKAREKRGEIWSPDLRLRGLGQEPGFFEAFVHGDSVVVHGLYDVLAFGLADGKQRWRFRVPFNFEIDHALMSGDMLVLAGKAETLALHIPTDNPAGEVAWQVKEEGDLYMPPFMHGDRLVSVRKLPFSVTIRYRATGRMMGRLHLPDLTLFDGHPLLKTGPRQLPHAHHQNLLIVSDGWYYIAIDVEKMTILWKRLIDYNDATRDPPMRFAVNEKFFFVLKEDYDQKVIYMLDSQTGEILWRTDPKNARSPQPIHSVFLKGDRAYGIGVHRGQGFYVVCYDGKTGKRIYCREEKGYDAKPEVSMLPSVFGEHLVVRVRDRQQFELKVFEAKTGKPVHKVRMKGAGSFGTHGKVSATVQNGRTVLMSKGEMKQ